MGCTVLATVGLTATCGAVRCVCAWQGGTPIEWIDGALWLVEPEYRSWELQVREVSLCVYACVCLAQSELWDAHGVSSVACSTSSSGHTVCLACGKRVLATSPGAIQCRQLTRCVCAAHGSRGLS